MRHAYDLGAVSGHISTIKLRPYEVAEIREFYQAHRGLTGSFLAESYGVSESHIYRIVSGICWSNRSTSKELTA